MATVDTTSGTGADVPRRSLEAQSPRYGERAIRAFFLACAALSVATTTAIVFSLLTPAVGFFQQVSFSEFFFGTLWAPSFADASFGVLPIVVGTFMVVFFSLIVAIPVGLLSAIYLSEYAPPRVRRWVKPALEVLYGIPTVAIGLFAFWLLRPLAEDVLPFLSWSGPFSVGVAGVAVGLMIVPLVASISDDAMQAVPSGLREGAYALGASKLKVSLRVVVPAAISGIVASIVLAASRAVGETMIVLIAAGAGNPQLSFDPLKGVQTMTAFIGGTATGDIPTGSLQYDTIFAVGALLFVMTLVMNVFAIRLVRRFREVYE
ncbi:MAG TPA: phosphate ABC transporter permease subunit PstC [Gaiellaceae bacterium]|nr:phosphate ABC transporter permease subunit PstC [Gaiellaceae bacterium]